MMPLAVAVQPVRPANRPVRAVAVILSAAVIVIGALWIVPGALDWTAYRGTMARFATTALGRPVRIDGPIAVRMLPEPLIAAADVRVGDAGGGLALSAPSLQLHLRWGPLLLGRLVPRTLVLSRPVVTLSWPVTPRALSAGPDWLSAASARIEGGRLSVGAVTFTDVNAEVASGGSEVGGLSIQGVARLFGQPWQFSERLSQPDAEGGTALEAQADAQPGRPTDPPLIATGHFVGTLGPSGTIVGQLSGHADDLSRLSRLPQVGASVAGTIGLGPGPAHARLALVVGGVAIDATLAPSAGTAIQSVLLHAGRIDWDRWSGAFARPARRRADAVRLPWPISLDVTADAVLVRGGLIRAAHAVLDLDRETATVRAASAVLPGEAALSGSGRVRRHDAAWQVDAAWSLAAPQLRTTLRWLSACGLRLPTDLPDPVLRDAMLDGQASVIPGRVELTGVRGTIDQNGAQFRLGVDTATGALDADVALDRLDGDLWWPSSDVHWAATSRALAGLAIAGTLRVGEVTWRGAELRTVALDAATNAGGLAVNGLDFDVDGLHAHARGTIAGDGALSDAALDLTAAQATTLGRALPGWAHFTDFLWSGPVHLHAEANGPAGALVTSIGLDLADARLEAHPRIDLGTGTWSAQMTVRHPGAPRLLGALGMAHGRDWLGEGSLSLLAQVSGRPGQVQINNFDLTAAGLHATGDLQLAMAPGARPMVTGQIAADTLPLPDILLGSHDAMPLAWVNGWNARIGITARSVLAGDAELFTGAAAHLELVDGVGRLDGLTAALGGGVLHASAVLDDTLAPPRLTLDATIEAAALGRPMFRKPVDLASGTVDAALSVQSAGYSPAALLAGLSGRLRLTATAGSIAGLDLDGARAAAAIPDAPAVSAALNGGVSRFDRLTADAALDAGIATLTRVDLEGPGGTTQIAGTMDLPGGTMNLLASASGQLGVRLIGPMVAPRRVMAGSAGF